MSQLNSACLLPACVVLSRCNGCDIIKKSTVRKGRYMVVFNFQLAPAAAGKLVSIPQLESDHTGFRQAYRILVPSI
jgi:hypothetical protein